MHVVLFSAMACLAMGIVVLTRAILSYQRYRLRFQKIFLVAFVLLLYHLLPNFIFGYFFINDETVLGGAPWRALRFAHSLQTPLMVALIAYLLIRLFLLLQRESWRRSWFLAFWGIQLAAFALRAASLAAWKSGSWFWYDSALFASLLVSYGSLIAVTWRAQARRFPHLSQVQARCLKYAGRAFAAIIFLFLAVDFTGIFFSIGGVASSFLSILPVFLLMAACLLFWDRFVVIMYPHLDAGRPQEERFRSLVEEFGISNREKEVVRLVCQGKTNREIEDALFISMATVKDHVSSIFRKTGATNRVQLAALFHFKE